MHYYQFNIGDYLSHTAHLDELEDLAYRRMLDYCYLNECGLPETVEEIARVIRMRLHCNCIASVLHEFFTQHSDGTFHSKRVDDEIEAYHAKSKARSKAARKRWENDDANALQKECKSNANHKPITNNHEPITSNHKPDEKQSADCQKKPDRRKETLDAKDLVKLGVDEQVARDWLAVRKKKKMPLTETALKKMQAEAAKVGITLVDAINICAEQPWGGFKSEYYQNMRVSSHEGQQATDRERQLSRSASGRVTLNAERELAEIARQRNDSSLVGDDVPALRPPVDYQFR